jgi:DNA repair protein RAD16
MARRKAASLGNASTAVGRRTRLSRASAANSEAASTPTASTYTSGSEKSTPITSGVGTPSTSFRESKTVRASDIEISLPARKLISKESSAPKDSVKALRSSRYALTSKRKRDEVDDSDDELYVSDESPDAALARRLQAAEYEQLVTIVGASAGPSRAPESRTRASRTSKVSSTVKITASSARGNKGKGKGKGKAVATESDFEDDESIVVRHHEDQFGDEVSDSDDYVPLAKRRKLTNKATTSTVVKRNLKTYIPSEQSDSEYDSDSEASVDEDAEEDGMEGSNAARGGNRLASRRGYSDYKNKKKAMTERQRLEKNHPELKSMWEDLKKMPKVDAGKAKQPDSISRILKPFQLEGIAWMAGMEKTKWKGGLLGDEMGLGKTIQAVSLIMSDHPAKRPSLVLAPPVALMQWQSEISSYTGGKLKTIMYHGTNSKVKDFTPNDLKKFDVIIMSYNSLESMYRKQEKGFSRKDGIFKEKSIIHQTHFHRIILDEAHCIKVRTFI